MDEFSDTKEFKNLKKENIHLQVKNHLESMMEMMEEELVNIDNN